MTSIIDDIRKMVLDDLPIGLYDAEVEAEKVRKAMLKGARLEGLEQGREEGIEQGIEQNKKEMILSMLKDNVPLDKISKYANISVEEVEKIINTSEEK